MGDLKNYRKLIYLVKTIDLNGKSDYVKSEKLLNKAIGELMVLTPQQTTLILRELNIIYENIQTFAKRYWRPDNFDLSNELAVILYKRFLNECFFIEWNDNDNQLKLDLETMHHIVWKVKENSVLLVKLKQSITPEKKDEDTTKTVLTGFQSSLSDKQLDDLYSKMGNYFDATPANFKAIFTNEALPFKFEKVKWIKLNRKKEPHKTALREFLTLVLDYSPDQKTLNSCISDSNGNNIQLAKPKAGEYSNSYSYFENMIKQI